MPYLLPGMMFAFNNKILLQQLNIIIWCKFTNYLLQVSVHFSITAEKSLTNAKMAGTQFYRYWGKTRCGGKWVIFNTYSDYEHIFVRICNIAWHHAKPRPTFYISHTLLCNFSIEDDQAWNVVGGGHSWRNAGFVINSYFCTGFKWKWSN